MEIFGKVLGSVDIHFLFGVTFILGVICLFYYSSARKQASIIHKLEISLRHFEQMNHQLALLVNEQRRANCLLSEVAGIEMPYSPVETHMNAQVAMNAQMNGYGNPTGYNPGRASNTNDTSAEMNSLTKLYVGNIDYAATEAELGAHFSRFGQVEFVNIPVNRYTGRARGFGFVTFISKESAERAIALNGSEFKGRQIQVNFAKERDLVL